MSVHTSTDNEKGVSVDADTVAREDLQKMGYKQEMSRVCPELSQTELSSTFPVQRTLSCLVQ